MTRRNTAAKTATGVPPRPLMPNNVDPNPFMGRESAIHNDSYSSDVSETVAPLGIYPEVGFVASKSGLAPAAVFFDDHDCAMIPYKSGCAGVVDLDGETIQVLGRFDPETDDTGGYGLQFAYSFTDCQGCLIGPTTHGHVVILRTRDGTGNLLEHFEKILDIDIFEIAVAQKACRKSDVDKLTLLSTVLDYDGNLWFTTGYYRIYPDRAPSGFAGFIASDCIKAALTRNATGVSGFGPVHFLSLSTGEGAENGISASKDGAVILTNKACYLLKAGRADVKVQWCTTYKSSGANDARPNDACIHITGGGLAWGSGTTPTLTKDLVLFTDNGKPNKLLALSMETGKLVASIPVLDTLPEGVRVSVENSILVYSGDPTRTSVVVCNWFGAGNPKLKDLTYPAKVSYDDLYDQNWVKNGNSYLYPGVERVDIVKDDRGGYSANKKWTRADLRGTSIFKLSTASGHLYCYDQNLETGMWMYRVLDFDSGATLLEVPVSREPEYNNMAVGMTIDTRGNALYCPSNTPNLLRLRDRFVYLPGTPDRAVDLGGTGRRRLSETESAELCGPAASFLHTARVEGMGSNETIAFRINGLSGSLGDFATYALNADGKPLLLTNGWDLTGEGGAAISGELVPETLYELRLCAGSLPGYDPAMQSVLAAVVLVRTNGT